ncbi:hypothetical protein KVV02_008249 [Mortierella alpina]|uniref:F-box domain-containing protein n=1 Tax=Mortierella alpina TaxID=64518 RepID=A0A9P8A8B1_MORAP|nr:hypothetical protein KVV02_008249 [Mortierella alpina]
MHSLSVNPPSPIAPLPPECLELILDCLRNDLASLCQLLLVSRQLFQLTVPVLYRSPFRLAAGIPDPPPHSDSHPHSPPHAYDSTTGWAKFLDRTKLLTRLLIQNLQIKPLGKVPRLTVHEASLLDDSSGMENLQPLLPATEQLDWPMRSPSAMIPSGRSQSYSTLSMDPNDISDDSAGPSVPGREVAQDGFGQCPDLIRFDDEWGAENDGWSASHQRTPSHQVNTGSGAASYSTDHNEGDREDRIKRQYHTHATGTGLLMDYFHFYSHVDHRSIASVIRHVYPGAGRRECDRFMAEIERAVLMHNPRQIMSIHVQCPSVVIPHLLANMDQFEQMSAIELLDAVWTIHELEMVYQFLSEHAAMFPAGNFETQEKVVSGHDGDEEVVIRPLAMRQGIRRRTAAIRHFKYATLRNHWDDTTLGGRRFDPLQLIKALGPGLEIIESVYWPRTTLQDLDSLDVSSLHTLRIGFLDTPREGMAFMELQHLRVHGPTDQVVFDILRDAFYGFRNSLRVLEARSDMEHLEGPALRRVLIKGPWHEITDRSLQQMIETTVRTQEPKKNDGSHSGGSSSSQPGERRWGDQLSELSVLDNTRTREYESSSNRRRAQDDSETIARKMIMKARLELPWVDLGPDASHLARRVRRDGYLSRGWDV